MLIRRRVVSVGVASALAATALLSAPSAPAAPGDPAPTRKQPVVHGRGGAVASVDADATSIGVRVLRRGGNAADAAVATAAALGVTEPYSAGLGGGGFFVYYDADTSRVTTIDSRETAPQEMPRDAFIDPDDGELYPFFPDMVTSGISVGVPGTPRLWAKATKRFGTNPLSANIMPAARLAARGFVVDETFNLQTEENAERFAQIRPTKRLFLPGGQAPEVGSVFRNPALARTYELIARRGVEPLYSGAIARQIVEVVQDPPTVANPDLPVPPGVMELSDLKDYTAPNRRPTTMRYRGMTIKGMGPPSSGGSTIGESLNILENYALGSVPRAEALHLYLEATALAYADRAAFLGDSDFVDVPLDELLSQGFGNERACEINPAAAAEKPVDAGEPDGDYAGCGVAVTQETQPDTEGLSTTHLVTADRWGNVASYTLTIEQTGGSGITVPGRGFLLNNELTDFSQEFVKGDPNRIQGGKRPRSSMSPTIVLRGGEPIMALGSPGGSTIITTVLQTLVNRIDFGMTLPRAVWAPRAAQRNTETVTAEQRFIDRWGTELEAFGHEFAPADEPGTSAAEIGAVAAIRLLPGGGFVAVAEKSRRGGGDAGVVRRR